MNQGPISKLDIPFPPRYTLFPMEIISDVDTPPGVSIHFPPASKQLLTLHLTHQSEEQKVSQNQGFAE